MTVAMKSQASQQFWIGLNNKNYEGSYEWLDGSDSKYRNWINGSTEDDVNSKDCVKVTNDGWIIVSCNTTATSVCEYKPGKEQFQSVSKVSVFIYVE